MALFFTFSFMWINHDRIVSIIKNMDPGFYEALDWLITDSITGESDKLMEKFNEECLKSKERAKNSKKKRK